MTVRPTKVRTLQKDDYARWPTSMVDRKLPLRTPQFPVHLTIKLILTRFSRSSKMRAASTGGVRGRRAAKTQARIDRYFEAFEAGTMKPELCSERIQDLKARLQELEVESRELEGRRKHLLRRLVKKVLVHDRHMGSTRGLPSGTWQ